MLHSIWYLLIFPTSPPSLTIVTIWIHLHCFTSFHHIPNTSINFPLCCLLIKTLVYIVQ
ncbi:hypothetical protein J3R30DRAFT_3481511 [Lentinula aciculospora]|uniref:Uncharacterized protein n=1 Tax=Lentinula aciculospora TaxID=153920 RepID=A0A9W9DP60_9AGAR|nr:hypothetical protein J3R30DRAFT_3481511 [Lentinula aciculospora]